MATEEIRSKELGRIYKRDKCVRASVVVKEATPKKAPLHDEFEWVDAVAAQQFRLGQARRLIRITKIATDRTGAKSRLIHVPPETPDTPTAATIQREGVYKPIKAVVRQESDFLRALRELQAHRAAMDTAIRQLKAAAKQAGKDVDLLPQLEDGLRIVKSTLRLRIQQAMETSP